MNKLPLDIQFFSTSGPDPVTFTKKNIVENGIVTGVNVIINSPQEISYIKDATTQESLIDDWFLSVVPDTGDTSQTAEKLYTTNCSEMIQVGYGSNMGGNMDVLEIEIDEIGTTVETPFSFCGSKCKHPVYTKDNFAVVEYDLTTTSESQSLSGIAINYPEGFNKNNTFLISHAITTTYRQTKFVTTYGSSPNFMFASTIEPRYYDASISLFGRLPSMTVGTKVKIQLLLMKVDV